jgi:hypothetical protein
MRSLEVLMDINMTPQQLDAIVKNYWDTMSNPSQSQEAFLSALAEVKAARARYESIPATVYPLGAFEVCSGALLIVDAYGTVSHAVVAEPVVQGIWQAFVGVETGTHVALFAYHETIVPDEFTTAYELIKQAAWKEIGAVFIDTATCAIADREAYEPLDIEKTSQQRVGIEPHLCFSSSANADGRYPVFAHSQQEQIKGVYVQFAEVLRE